MKVVLAPRNVPDSKDAEKSAQGGAVSSARCATRTLEWWPGHGVQCGVARQCLCEEEGAHLTGRVISGGKWREALQALTAALSL